METVFSHWIYADETMDTEFITNTAIRGRSAGLLVDGVLVSWGIELRDGGIHAVHTLKEHRRQGYAKMLMRYLCRTVAKEDGHFPIVHIGDGNDSSKALMTGIGFQFTHSIYWTEYFRQD